MRWGSRSHDFRYFVERGQDDRCGTGPLRAIDETRTEAGLTPWAGRPPGQPPFKAGQPLAANTVVRLPCPGLPNPVKTCEILERLETFKNT